MTARSPVKETASLFVHAVSIKRGHVEQLYVSHIPLHHELFMLNPLNKERLP